MPAQPLRHISPGEWGLPVLRSAPVRFLFSHTLHRRFVRAALGRTHHFITPEKCAETLLLSRRIASGGRFMGVAAWRHAGKPKKPQVFCCFHFTTAWRSRIIKLTRKESKHFPFVLFVRAEAVQCQ